MRCPWCGHSRANWWMGLKCSKLSNCFPLLPFSSIFQNDLVSKMHQRWYYQFSLGTLLLYQPTKWSSPPVKDFIFSFRFNVRIDNANWCITMVLKVYGRMDLRVRWGMEHLNSVNTAVTRLEKTLKGRCLIDPVGHNTYMVVGKKVIWTYKWYKFAKLGILRTKNPWPEAQAQGLWPNVGRIKTDFACKWNSVRSATFCAGLV